MSAKKERVDTASDTLAQKDKSGDVISGGHLVAKALKQEYGVGCGVYYPIPNHKLPSLRSFAGESPLNHTDRAAGEVLSLPVHPFLTNRHLAKIVKAVNTLAKAGG